MNLPHDREMSLTEAAVRDGVRSRPFALLVALGCSGNYCTQTDRTNGVLPNLLPFSLSHWLDTHDLLKEILFEKYRRTARRVEVVVHQVVAERFRDLPILTSIMWFLTRPLRLIIVRHDGHDFLQK
jgi:hypothetical protein